MVRFVARDWEFRFLLFGSCKACEPGVCKLRRVARVGGYAEERRLGIVFGLALKKIWSRQNLASADRQTSGRLA